jgi:LysR family glycine cleavage system transcriptional activator
LSFTAAAAELHRTQSAVSHRIKALEAQIGVPLFHRHARGLELTSAGHALARQVEQAMADITRTLTGLDRTGEVRQLRVTMLPSVASRWLMPRLSRLYQLHPDLQVQVIADARVLDLRAERIDLAIRFGGGRYSGHAATLLMGDRMLPVCSPRLLANRPAIATIESLFQLPLLHDSSAENDGSLSDWRSWLDQLGYPELSCRAGQRFSHAGLAIEGAVLGMGVTLGRLSLVTDHLANGTLVCPLPLTTPTAYAYYLVTLPDTATLPNVVLFSEWLRAEAQEMTGMAAEIDAAEMRLREISTDPRLRQTSASTLLRKASADSQLRPTPPGTESRARQPTAESRPTPLGSESPLRSPRAQPRLRQKAALARLEDPDGRANQTTPRQPKHAATISVPRRRPAQS